MIEHKFYMVDTCQTKVGAFLYKLRCSKCGEIRVRATSENYPDILLRIQNKEGDCPDSPEAILANLKEK